MKRQFTKYPSTYVNAYWNMSYEPRQYRKSALYEHYKNALLAAKWPEDLSEIISEIANDQSVTGEEFNELYGLAVELGV
jgi:hypothetical protein